MKPILNVVIGIFVGAALSAGIWLATSPPRGESVVLRPAPTPEPLRVHVAGAVLHPGVYTLDENSRVEDAVYAAGGFLADADENALNLAAKLEDGERLDIPYVAGFVPNETSGFVVITESAPPLPPGEGDLVNINTASLEELDKLPGIGATIAQRIIDYRTENGPFATIDDIVNVPGIGTATFEEIKDLITVGV
jgi:competence protein ComEA